MLKAQRNAKDRRDIAWTIALIIVGAYVIWQLVGVWTAKDAEPPAWLISPPAGATFVGDPWIDPPARQSHNVG